MIQPGNIQDRLGARTVLEKAAKHLTRLKCIWADGGYTGLLANCLKAQYGWSLEIVSKPPGLKTFQPLPKRWIVERTFAWLNSYRLLAKEYERTLESSKNDTYLAMSRCMLKRLAPS